MVQDSVTGEPPRPRNLSETDDVTGFLLSNPAVWRSRAVEDILVESASTCIRRRSLQVAPLRAMLGRRVSAADREVTIGLPVARMPKGPLSNFSITGPHGPALVLPRLEIAERELSYLTSLAQTVGVNIEAPVGAVLIEVLGFTDEWVRLGKPKAEASHRASTLSGSQDTTMLERLRTLDANATRVLSTRRAATLRIRATERPSLVLAKLMTSGLVADDDEAVVALESYAALLVAMETHASDGHSEIAGEFLDNLADYGSHYDLIAALSVPLDQAFVVKYEERRPLTLERWTNRGVQTVESADALSNHIAVRVMDPNVRLGTCRLGIHGQRVADAAYEPVSHSDTQSTTWYGHEPGREVRVDVEFTVRLLPRLLVVPTAVAVLNTLIAVALLVEGVTDLATLAIVTSPAALAASLLTTREPSTLGSRLRRLSTALLGASLILLIATATALFTYGKLSGC